MSQKTSAETASLSRRQFVAKSGAAAAGVTILSKKQPWEYNNPILGSGEHTYECIHEWLVPPDSIKFGDTQGVAQDAQGRIYISHTVGAGSQSGDAIAVFDPKGKFITSWGSRFRGGGHGLDLRKEGREEFLYHCDTAHRQVVKTTLSGEVVWEKGLPKEAGTYGEKDNFIPTNVAFAPNGDFYVTDGYGSDWIHQYSIKGDYIRSFGGRGKEAGKVANAHGIWVDTRGKIPEVCVCDRGNNRLQYFTMDGSHLRFVSEGMRSPCQADIRKDLMLIPDLSSVITILGKDNKVVVQLGDGHPSALRNAPREKWIPGKFIHPHDAMFLKNGDICVAEWVPTGRVTLLKRK